MKINLMYEVIGSFPYEIDLEDYIDKEEWEEMTYEERDAFLFDLSIRLHSKAERELGDWSLGEMEDWEIEED